MKLSMIVPCYNEKNLLPELIALVKRTPVEDKEIILMDDGSTGGTTEMIMVGLEKEVDRVVCSGTMWATAFSRFFRTCSAI
jgi:glycosyltransferase involved in cell wall biosynthesis